LKFQRISSPHRGNKNPLPGDSCPRKLRTRRKTGAEDLESKQQQQELQHLIGEGHRVVYNNKFMKET
jgi:hypothetical protein